MQALKREDATLTRYFDEIDEGMEHRQLRAFRALSHLPAEEPKDALLTRRRIMKNRYIRPLTAATILVAMVVSVQWLFAPVPVYGLTESLKRWQDARTIHIKGWMFLDPGNRKLEKFPFELWFDRSEGCFRNSHPMDWFGDYTSDPEYSLTVSDGQYVMDVCHRQNKGRAEFTRLSPFAQRLQARTLEAFPTFMGNLDRVEGFHKIGREQIRGRAADVWEGEITAVGEAVPYTRQKIWLSPSTGEILHFVRWENMGEQENSVDWQMRMDTETIEYNTSPPADCFKTDPPESCELINTKETAVTRELGEDGQSRLYDCIGFTLNDGAVVLGWHANHKPQESQAGFFADLVPAGPLPQLPARIVALKPWPVREDITCVGHHLAWTQKNGKFYEWGIYVADRKVPERSTFKDYKIISVYDGVEARDFGGRPNLVGEQLTVTSEREFDTWVGGAMAELSDSGTAPAHVTYRAVLELAQQIRTAGRR